MNCIQYICNISLGKSDEDSKRSPRWKKPRQDTLDEINKLQWAIVLVTPMDDDDLPLSKLISSEHLKEWESKHILISFYN